MNLGARIAALDWTAIDVSLDQVGCAVTGPLLSAGECAALADLYPGEAGFRSRVIMARHGFGRGEYKYFDHPLPPLVATLRQHLYSRLIGTANRRAKP